MPRSSSLIPLYSQMFLLLLLLLMLIPSGDSEVVSIAEPEHFQHSPAKTCLCISYAGLPHSLHLMYIPCFSTLYVSKTFNLTLKTDSRRRMNCRLQRHVKEVNVACCSPLKVSLWLIWSLSVSFHSVQSPLSFSQNGVQTA